jgi:hypothetical protein
MCRKLFLLASLVLVVGLVSSASAAPNWVGTVDRAWGTGGNWSGGAVPGTADQPGIAWASTAAPYTPLISAETSAVAKLSIGGTNQDGYLEITGGSLTVGPGPDGVSDALYAGNQSDTTANGNNPDARRLDMSGGFLDATCFRLGRRALASFYMTGGTAKIDRFKMGARTNDPGGMFSNKSIVRLMGGLLDTDQLDFNRTAGGRLDMWIGAGEMLVDATMGVSTAAEIDAQLDYMLATKQLRPYGMIDGTTEGSVTYLIVRSWDEVLGEKTILHVTAIPEPATIALLGLGGLALLRRRR